MEMTGLQGLTAASDNMPARDRLFLRCPIDVTAEHAGLLHKVRIKVTLLHLFQQLQLLPSCRAIKDEAFPGGEEQPDAFPGQVERLGI